MIRTILVLCAGALAACARDAGGDRTRIVVYNAGSLARPMRAALDSFAARTSAVTEQESAGSLESARKLTELGKTPDLIALADHEIFPTVLMPEHVRWYAGFARNRMVIAYTARSRGAGDLARDGWRSVLARPGIAVARAEPALDPNGYRTLLVLRLAERLHADPGFEARMLALWGPRYVRPKEADLVGLLQAGEVDYIWSYESIARAAGLPFLALGDSLDLGAPQLAEWYRSVSVRVPGRTRADTIVIAGAPIVYGFSIPVDPPHPGAAVDFAAFLLSPAGAAAMRAEGLDVLPSPVFAGDSIPPALAASDSVGRVPPDSKP